VLAGGRDARLDSRQDAGATDSERTGEDARPSTEACLDYFLVALPSMTFAQSPPSGWISNLKAYEVGDNTFTT
jgi:hypothetical protein